MRSRLYQLVACLLILSVVSGCENRQANVHDQEQKLLKDDDNLYEAYLQADTDHARQILGQKIQLSESDRILEQAGFRFEHRLFLDYARLYVLEKRAGNEEAAEAALIKGHYWLLRGCEMEKMPVQQAIEQLRTATSDQIVSMVDKQDKSATGGIGPKYLQSIHAGATGKGVKP